MLVFILLVTLGTAATVYSVLDLRSTSHYDTGNQAFAAAESGIMHALSTMNAAGAIHFRDDVVQRWTELYGSTQKSMPGDANVQYQVALASDAGNPSEAGTITATGLAPLSARRVLRVNVRRGGFRGAPGAIYLAGDNVNSQFTGNAFEVDGNDHDVFGNPAPSGPVLPGISTRNSGVTDAVRDSLDSTQKDNVRGLGFSLSPLTPSVETTGGPSVADLDQITSNLLGMPGVVNDGAANFNGGQTFGSMAAPQITHMTSSSVTLNGDASGAGILIVDGSLTISGNLDFLGWIIVRGDTVINATSGGDDETDVLGNATINGSLWTGHLEIKVGGSAIVDYCDACMRLVDSMSPTGALPQPMTIVSWAEVL